jgi:glycosyltransferase 2 family protein
VKHWKLWLGILISAAFMYLALRGLELGQVWGTLRSAKLGWLIPAVLIYFIAVWGRALRWRYLLRPIKLISMRDLFVTIVIGYMGNNVYPARAGELIRAYVLRKREDIHISATLATIIVERIFDGVVMLLFVFVSLPFMPMPAWLQRVVIIGGGVFFGALAVFIALALSESRAKRVYDWLIDHLLPVRFREPIRGFADRFMQGLYALRSGRDFLMVLLISPGIWLVETVVYWLVMQGFDFQVPFYALMLMSGVVNLATTIPSSPGYVGTFDALGIRVLEGFSVSSALAAGYTLVLHATLWLPITLLGAIFMWRESIKWSEFSEAEKLVEPGDA